MISGIQVKKLLLIASFLIIAIYTGLPSIQSVSNGLPYHHFWDEPVVATGALIAVKTNKLIPKGLDLVYGGGIRYPLMLIDFVYYQYLKLVPYYEVGKKSDIKTYLEGVYKTTSHSGFYYWSRVFVVMIYVLGFLFVFEIGRIRGGYTMGFIAVILLASVQEYYGTSYMVLMNVPLSTWMLGAILFSLKFDKDKSIRNLYYSLICVGLAGATKYTGALTFLIPLTAAILNRDIFKWSKKSDIAKSILKWGGISFGVFTILNPVVITFPDRLYKTIVELGWVYRTGQGHFSKEPGLEHLKYQIGELILHFGTILFIIALAGILLCLVRLTRKSFWINHFNTGFLIIVLFPCFYLVYVTSIYTIAYHRNFYLMYPILAILSAEACFTVINLLSKLSKFARFRIILNIVMMALIFYLSFPGYSNIWKLSRHIYNSIETRTSAILEVNKLAKGNAEVFLGVNNDLLISPEDLRKLKVDYEFYNISNINNSIQRFTHLLVPDYNFNLQVQDFDSLNIVVKGYISEKELIRIPGRKLDVHAILSDHENPIVNPTVIIIKGEVYLSSRKKN